MRTEIECEAGANLSRREAAKDDLTLKEVRFDMRREGKRCCKTRNATANDCDARHRPCFCRHAELGTWPIRAEVWHNLFDMAANAGAAAPLEEYRAIRAEISQEQQARLFILGFVFTATGVVGGTVLGSQQDRLYLLVPGLAFLQLLVAQAVLLTTAYTRRIDIKAAYIRQILESTVPTLRYETMWDAYRRADRPFGRGVLGTSRALSQIYGLLAAALLIAAGLFNVIVPVQVSSLALIALGALDFLLIADLYFRLFPWWRIRNWA
jgi:hypothetical protein